MELARRHLGLATHPSGDAAQRADGRLGEREHRDAGARRERPVVHPDHDGDDGLGQGALDLDESVDGQSHEVGHRRGEDDDQRVDIAEASSCSTACA